MGENEIMLNAIIEYLNKLFTKLFGSKPTISNTDSNGNTNLSGNNNNNSNNNNNNSNSNNNNNNNNNSNSNNNINSNNKVINNPTFNIFQAEKKIDTVYNDTLKITIEIKEDKIKQKKDIFQLKNELYDNLLAYRNEVFAIDPLHLFLIDNKPAYKKKIRAINDNINKAIEVLREDYPELCNLAKKVSSDINSYYDVAVIYGKMKNDNVNSGAHYNYVCHLMDENTENVYKSTDAYINEHTK